MAAKVKTEKELNEALHNNEETIEISGDLATKTFKIRATGKVAWAVAIGGLTVAAYGIFAAPATGGASGVAGFTAGAAAVGVLGGPAAASAIGLIVAAGGATAGLRSLKKLRGYKEISRTPDSLVLKRR